MAKKSESEKALEKAAAQLRRDRQEKYRQMRRENATYKYIDDTRAMAYNVSRRMARFAQNNINSPALAHLRSAAKGAGILQGNKIVIPRGADFQKIVAANLILSKFLAGETSTIRGAKKYQKEKKENFNRLLNRLGFYDKRNSAKFRKKFGENWRDTVYDLFSSLDFKALLEQYLYEEVAHAVTQLSLKGYSVSDENVKEVLENGIRAFEKKIKDNPEKNQQIFLNNFNFGED